VDSRNVGGRSESIDELIAAIQRGEEVKIETLLTSFSFRDFDQRFYGVDRASTVNLMNHCKHDSPARLEAKEGFLATLIYNLVYSGSLMDAEDLEFGRIGQANQFKQYITQSQDWENLWISGPKRDIASENARAQRAEKIFLASFRNLVIAIKNGQTITTKEFLDAIINERSSFDQDIKLKVAYQVMKVTKGLWFKPKSEEEKKAITFFQTPGSIQRNIDGIYQFLTSLHDQDRLKDVYAKLGQTQEIYVSFPSGFAGGRNRRINVNLAYHIDLIDMFGGNNAAINELAVRLDRGDTFNSPNEFLQFAERIGKRTQAQKMLDEARKEINEVQNLSNRFMIQDLRNRHLGN